MNVFSDGKLWICALMLCAACSDSNAGSDDITGTAQGVDPSTVGVGGSLSGVSATTDTDGDGVPDVEEGTGDGNGNGIPAHLDSRENGASPSTPGGSQDGSASTGGTEDSTVDSSPPPGTEQDVDGGSGGTTGEPGGTTDSGSQSSADDPNTKGHDAAGHVACGESVSDCDQSSHVCCVNATMSADCRSGAECGFGSEATACDGPEDCPSGQVCCVHISFTGADSTCEAPSAVNDNGGRCASSGQIGNFELCHTDADCDPTTLCDQNGRTFSFWAFCK